MRSGFGLHEGGGCESILEFMTKPLNRRNFFKIFLLIFFGSVFLHPFSIQAQPSPGNPLKELLDKVRLIEERVKKIETNQQEILDRQEKILAELDNLRLWVARR